MCKCCQQCMESCYWHLIEEKFCFDEKIALYEEPGAATPTKNEKNNNMFDNMAFYDSVSVIAGRAIVTIDPLPSKKDIIFDQPKKRLISPKDSAKDLTKILECDGDEASQKPVPFIVEEPASTSTDTGDTTTDSTDGDSSHDKHLITRRVHKKSSYIIKKAVSFNNIPDKSQLLVDDNEEKSRSSSENLSSSTENDVELRRKSLRERRMSKSLYLKIDYPKEVPIIRQNSMPKFYLDTPDENQLNDSSIGKPLSTIFQSPMTVPEKLDFDLYTVVQREKMKQSQPPPAPIHRNPSKLNLIKDKVMLKKSKSTVSASTVPFSNHI